MLGWRQAKDPYGKEKGWKRSKCAKEKQVVPYNDFEAYLDNPIGNWYFRVWASVNFCMQSLGVSKKTLFRFISMYL